MNRYSRLFSLFFFCFFFQLIIAQDKADVRNWFVEAESFFLFEDYKDALPLYQRILRVESENYNVQSRIGVCYLNDLYQVHKSISYLETASEHINHQYRIGSFREKLAPPETQYYLGRAYHINNRFNEAIESYQRFLNIASEDEYDLEVVKADIKACQLAKKQYSKPIFFAPKNLGPLVNSSSEDINPVISGDGKVLAFTRKLPFYTGVFISVKNEDGTWSPPVNLTGDFGLDGDTYTTGISFFGDEIFVYRSDNYDGNIYSSKRINNKWSNLKKLNENINTKYWESHASPSPDGQYLIFTSNREGGYGGLDIYRSMRNANGVWGKAVNMGPVVNSPNNEDTPFLGNEGYSLFFSSQGHNTTGGYDVFLSNLQGDGTWSKPHNMGHPVNTTNDNLFYCPLSVDAFGLYAFYDEESTEGMLDIYEVEIYNEKIPRTFKVYGALTYSDLEELSSSRIRAKLIRAGSRKLADEKKISTEGTFELTGTQGEYILRVEGEGIETYEQEITFDLNEEGNTRTIENIDLKKTEKTAEKPAVKEIRSGPVIKSKKEFFSVTDSLAIPVELLIPKGSTLEIVASVNDSILLQDKILDVKRRFTYFYKPQAGENLLKFMATDPDGNVSETSVVISYIKPKEEIPVVPEITRDTVGSDVYRDFLMSMASDPLAKYLEELDLASYDDMNALYTHLLEEAPNNEYTVDDVQKMFSVFFSQRDLDSFIRDLVNRTPIEDSISNNIRDSVQMPYEYLVILGGNTLPSETDLRNALLEILESPDKSGTQTYIRLCSYSETSPGSEADLIASGEQAWSLVSDDLGEDSAMDMLRMAASTEELNFFFQNLLVSSEGGLHEMLMGLDLQANQIYNSVDLVKYLFEQVSEDTYSTEELIAALDKARLNKVLNMKKFQELLTTEAEGILKSQLLETDEEIEDMSTYENLVSYLLSQSQYRKYNRESVYDLLLKLIGIQMVDEFAEKLTSFGYSEINSAIADTSLTLFSSPLELVQYLIAATQTYNFTTSDLNNLLIRMILERGLHEDAGGYYEDELEKKFWKGKRFIATVILANIVLLILLILFLIRRRRSGGGEH